VKLSSRGEDPIGKTAAPMRHLPNGEPIHVVESVFASQDW